MDYLTFPRNAMTLLQVMLSVWEGLENTNLGLVEDSDGLSGLGQDWDTLSLKLDTNLLSFLLGQIVGLNSLNECFVASTLANMLNSNVNSLAKLVTTMNLGHLNSDSGLGHVENNTSSTVVELIRHTLVDGWIRNNINVVTLFESGQIS